jgi:hypothetical protein
MLAMAALNDVNVAAAFSDRSAVAEYWRLREELGLSDAEFVGSWRPDCPVRVTSGLASASAYRTRKGLVLVVANPKPSAQTIRLHVDRERIGALPTQAVDARTGARQPIQDGELEVALGARSYSFLTLRSR